MNNNDYDYDTSNKSKLVCLIFFLFFGFFGIHRMYVGKVISGIMQFFFGWATLFIWNTIDFILIISGNFRDSDGKLIKKMITNE